MSIGSENRDGYLEERGFGEAQEFQASTMCTAKR